MQHIFDIDIAKEYGVDVAIFLKNLSYWIHRNQANDLNLYDERYWTYNKVEAFSKIFPYWSYKQLRRIIDLCVKNDLIMKGNYNKSAYDKTLWYAFTDKGLNLFPYCQVRIGQSDSPKWANQIAQEGDTIPNINTNNKTQIKIKDKAQSKKQIAVVDLPEWLDKSLWEDFKQFRKEMKKPMTELIQKKTINRLDKMRSQGQNVEDVLNQSMANGWQGIFEVKSNKGNNHGNQQQRTKSVAEIVWERSTAGLPEFENYRSGQEILPF